MTVLGANRAAADSAQAGAGDPAAAPVEGDSPSAPAGPTLAIHYVVANQIIIRMVDGQVDVMEVRGLQRGMHQEPRRTTANAGRDR